MWLIQYSAKVYSLHVLFNDQLKAGLHPRVDNRPHRIFVIVVNWIWHCVFDLERKL